MKKQFFFLCILLTLRGWAFAQQNIKPSLSITISTKLDTFNIDKYFEQKLYQNDTFFRITVQNNGQTNVKLPASLGPSYEAEPSGIGDIYFKTFYDSSAYIVSYNRQSADIDYFFTDDVVYSFLKQGEKRVIHKNALTINGVPDGVKKVYIEVYLRLPPPELTIFKSNRISIVTKHLNKR